MVVHGILDTHSHGLDGGKDWLPERRHAIAEVFQVPVLSGALGINLGYLLDVRASCQVSISF